MNIEIANRLYEYRKANGFSQEELAEKIGVSRQAISKWERSESSPDTDNLIALAKLYNVSLDEMINGSSAPVKAEKIAPEEESVSEPQQQEEAQIPINNYNTTAYPIYANNGSDNGAYDGYNSINSDAIHSQQFNNQAVQTDNEKKKAPWLSVLIWIGGIILFLLVGALFPKGWSVSWIILLLTPVIDSGIDAVLECKPQKFAYSLLVTALFCALGMCFGLWHPAWVLFLTIPVYYTIISSLKKPEQPEQKKRPIIITFAVIFSIVVCSTLGMVCNTALHGRKGHNDSIGSMFNYENSDAYLIGGATVSAQNIDSLEVDWVNGSVTVNPSNDGSDEITFNETQPKSEDLTLRYMVDKGTLKIQFCKAHIGISSLKDCKKDITITVPEKVFNKLDIDSVNAQLNINSVNASELLIDNVSGRITARGAYNSIDIDNVSGNAIISNSSDKSDINIDTVSGDFTLNLPQDVRGFIVNYDCVSGIINSEGFKAEKNNKTKTVTYGDLGSVNIDFDSVSGNLNIRAE